MGNSSLMSLKTEVYGYPFHDVYGCPCHDVYRCPFHVYGRPNVLERLCRLSGSKSGLPFHVICHELADLIHIIMKTYHAEFLDRDEVRVTFENIFLKDSNLELYFLVDTLPVMAEMAKRVFLKYDCCCYQRRTWCTLEEQNPSIKEIKKKEVLFLLVVAFFCLPGKISFQRLYRLKANHVEIRQQKLRCLLEYFVTAIRDDKDSINAYIFFEKKTIPRHIMTYPFAWSGSQKALCTLLVKEHGTIEDAPDEKNLKVDFANRRIGGGVLGDGCMQEEIIFAIYPEMIAAMAIFPDIKAYETVEVSRVKRYSNYHGYGSSFTFSGPSTAKTLARFVAMDAINFGQRSNSQYEEEEVIRELRKALCGFTPGRAQVDGVVTGNWGCGVFGGDVVLKCMLQWMAASQAELSSIEYYTFGHPSTREMQIVVQLITDTHTVGQLYDMVISYCQLKMGNFSGGFLQFLRVIQEAPWSVIVLPVQIKVEI